MQFPLRMRLMQNSVSTQVDKWIFLRMLGRIAEEKFKDELISQVDR